MDAHPAASVFPMLSETELADLAADIREHKQREPIVVHEGKILDGRNRWAACQLAGVEPRVKPWDGEGGTPLNFVVSMNLKRRHLTESQRAAVAAELIPFYEADAKAKQRAAWEELRRQGGKFVPRDRPAGTNLAAPETRAAGLAGQALNVSRASVQSAKRVQREAPELFEKVKAGEMTVHAANQAVKQRQPRTERKEGAKPRQKQERPERRGPVLAYSMEWARVRKFAREQWFPLAPDKVAATLAGDEVAAAQGFITQCSTWLGAFSSAIEGRTERVAQ